MDSYDILKDIRQHVTLEQLLDSLGNVNYANSVVWYWIFDSNYEGALLINRELLDMICAPSVGEEQVTELETLFTDVIYILSTSHLNKE